VIKRDTINRVQRWSGQGEGRLENALDQSSVRGLALHLEAPPGPRSGSAPCTANTNASDAMKYFVSDNVSIQWILIVNSQQNRQLNVSDVYYKK
jgi:hypothetical protein